MNMFKIILKVLVPIIIFIMILSFTYNMFNNNITNKMMKINTNITTAEEKQMVYSCTKSDKENMEQLAKDNELDYYEGEIVIKEVSKNFSNSMIPKDYSISSNDLESGYALGNNNSPKFLLLTFKDERKYEHIKEFFGYGEVFVGYTMRTDSSHKEIFLSDTYENSEKYINQFLIQRCY